MGPKVEHKDDTEEEDIVIVRDSSTESENVAKKTKRLLLTLDKDLEIRLVNLFDAPKKGISYKRLLFVLNQAQGQKTRKKGTTHDSDSDDIELPDSSKHQDYEKKIKKWKNDLVYAGNTDDTRSCGLVFGSGNEPVTGLRDSHSCQINSKYEDVFDWWPRVLKFLCITKNRDRSAYILLHAGIGINFGECTDMIERIKTIEQEKKKVEVMLGLFKLKNIHTASWVAGAAVDTAKEGFKLFASIAPTVIKAAGVDMPPGTEAAMGAFKDAQENTHLQEVWSAEKKKVDSILQAYMGQEPLKSSFFQRRAHVAVIPIFVLSNGDISVNEKCCLTEYAEQFRKSHFICLGKEEPSEYLKLVSSNVYGRSTQMDFIFNALKDMKVIVSVNQSPKDNCVCTCCSVM